MNSRTDSCSARSLALDEDLTASAPPAAAWVLVEHAGPWPAQPVGALLPDLAAALQRVPDVRPLLIRRTWKRSVSEPWCFLVGGGSRPWVEARRLRDHDEVLTIDLDALARGERQGFGEPHEEPLFLVCTHARRDACCGVLGRPIVQALAERLGAPVWECTHLGGHRFAGTLAIFPQALLFGRLTPESALRVADTYRAGEIDLDTYRGCAWLPSAAQAAEQVARRAVRATGVDAVEVAAVEEVRDGVTDVCVTVAGLHVRVRVREEEAVDARALSCGGTPEHPRTLATLDILAVPA